MSTISEDRRSTISSRVPIGGTLTSLRVSDSIHTPSRLSSHRSRDDVSTAGMSAASNKSGILPFTFLFI